MVKEASSNIGLILLVPTRGSTALAMIGLQRAKARCSRLLQGTLLREVSSLTTSVASTALSTGIRIESVAVTS
jgi:hypothetical protein